MHHAYLLFNMHDDFFDAMVLNHVSAGLFWYEELAEDCDMAYCGGGPI